MGAKTPIDGPILVFDRDPLGLWWDKRRPRPHDRQRTDEWPKTSKA